MMTDSHLGNCHSLMTLMIKWQIQFAKKHTNEKKSRVSQSKLILMTTNSLQVGLEPG